MVGFAQLGQGSRSLALSIHSVGAALLNQCFCCHTYSGSKLVTCCLRHPPTWAMLSDIQVATLMSGGTWLQSNTPVRNCCGLVGWFDPLKNIFCVMHKAAHGTSRGLPCVGAGQGFVDRPFSFHMIPMLTSAGGASYLARMS